MPLMAILCPSGIQHPASSVQAFYWRSCCCFWPEKSTSMRRNSTQRALFQAGTCLPANRGGGADDDDRDGDADDPDGRGRRRQLAAPP